MVHTSSFSLSYPSLLSSHTYSISVSHAFRKSDVDAEPEASPGSSSSSGAVDALSTAPSPAPQASAGKPGQEGDSSCFDSDSPIDSSSCEEEEEEGEEGDPTMFSSKFLSGANPLNAVSSAVNKFSLFGDDGGGDKNKKAPSQQGGKPSEEKQPAAGSGKGPQQQQGPQTSGQPLPKEGSPQLRGNRQNGPPNKPGGHQAAPKAGTQPEGQVKREPQQSQPKGPPQQGSPKPGAQQQIGKSGAQPGSPKASSQHVPPKTEIQQQQQQQPAKTGTQQQQQPAKTGVQDSTKVASQNTGSQHKSPEVGQQQQGSPRIGQQQGSPKLSQQGSPKVAQQGSSQVGQQQQGFRTTLHQQSSDKPRSQLQDSKGPGTPGQCGAGSSSPEPTKAGPQSKAAAKSLCPVCNITELNMHTKESPNHKTCSQCETEVCSLCGFSPPDSDVSNGLVFCLCIICFICI